MGRYALSGVFGLCLIGTWVDAVSAQQPAAGDRTVQFTVEFALSPRGGVVGGTLDVTFFGALPGPEQVDAVVRHCSTAAATLHPQVNIKPQAWLKGSPADLDRKPVPLADDVAGPGQASEPVPGSTDGDSQALTTSEANDEGLSSVLEDPGIIADCKGIPGERLPALLAAGAEKRDQDRRFIVKAMRDWCKDHDVPVDRELRVCMSALSKAVEILGGGSAMNPEQLAAAVTRGAAAYNLGQCAKCHQQDGRGGARGPDLTDAEWLHCDGTVEGIRKVLVTGVPQNKLKDPNRPFQMNPATNLITDDSQLTDLAAYVQSLGRK